MRLRGAMVALVLATFTCFPASAGASRHQYLLPAGAMTRISLAGTNGYRVRVYSRSPGNVVVVVTKEGVSTEYEVRAGRERDDRVRARLPGLGSISVRFLQRGPAHHPPAIAGCDGPRPTLRRGVVRGTIEFRGERGYTEVAAHEADAEIEEWARQHCRYGRPHPRPNWTNRFQAWGGETLRVNFSATKYPAGAIEGGRVVFRASSPSSRGGLFISRRAEVVAPASTFRVPEPSTYPEHVIIAPPAPFAGSGTLARTPESVFTWEGDLSVQFPGLDPIPLAGPGVAPHYCAMRGCISQDVESEPGSS